MRTFSGRLLAVILILVLAFAPLQAAFSGINYSENEQQTQMQQNHGAHGAMDQAADGHSETKHDCCKQAQGWHLCKSGDKCGSQECTDSQCSSCVLAILAQLAYYAPHLIPINRPYTVSAVITFSPATLFRPPIA